VITNFTIIEVFQKVGTCLDRTMGVNRITWTTPTPLGLFVEFFLFLKYSTKSFRKNLLKSWLFF
jgi:hypothetical protein